MEILVVLILVGLLAGLLLVNPPATRVRELRMEGDLLYSLLRYASDEAVMQGMELGLSIQDNGYQFLQFDVSRGRWLPAEDQILRARTLPCPIEIGQHPAWADLPKLSGMASLALTGEVALQGKARTEPQLLLLSSGETTPFSLALGCDEDEPIRISGDGFSGIHLEAAQIHGMH